MSAPEPLDAEQPARPESKLNLLAKISVVVALAVVIGTYVYVRETAVFVPRQVTHNMPTVRCRPVSKEDIEYLSREENWKHTVRSMRWHMDVNQLEGISAFHMGEPTCFILIRLNDGKTILPMFNAVFRGFSTTAIVARNEESLACTGVIRNMLRAQHVRVSYVDGNTGEEMVELFSGPEAFALQHVNFYSLGHTICDLHAANADKGVATLRERLVADTSL